jgi:hypothetical protein
MKSGDVIEITDDNGRKIRIRVLWSKGLEIRASKEYKIAQKREAK